jgi:hypothetical protein
MSAGAQKSQRQASTPQAGPPRAGQHVRVAGRGEVFLILRVDRKRHLADLLSHGAVRKVEQGVPLALLRVVEPNAGDTGHGASKLSREAS